MKITPLQTKIIKTSYVSPLSFEIFDAVEILMKQDRYTLSASILIVSNDLHISSIFVFHAWLKVRHPDMLRTLLNEGIDITDISHQ
jgi:hypothetical protein